MSLMHAVFRFSLNTNFIVKPVFNQMPFVFKKRVERKEMILQLIKMKKKIKTLRLYTRYCKA